MTSEARSAIGSHSTSPDSMRSNWTGGRALCAGAAVDAVAAAVARNSKLTLMRSSPRLMRSLTFVADARDLAVEGEGDRVDERGLAGAGGALMAKRSRSVKSIGSGLRSDVRFLISRLSGLIGRVLVEPV